MDNMAIANKLVRLRDNLGLQQKEAARRIRVSPQFLGQAEKGKPFRIDTLIRICDFYGVSADWLLGMSDQRARSEVLEDFPEMAVIAEAWSNLTESRRRDVLKIIDLMVELSEEDKQPLHREDLLSAAMEQLQRDPAQKKSRIYGNEPD